MPTLSTAPLNGVNTDALLTTRGHIKEMPELAKFQFRVRNEWISGIHSVSRVNDYYGASQEVDRGRVHEIHADHPELFAAEDAGASAAELLLAALASCITGGIASIAAARGIELTKVESVVEGDVDLNGTLGLDEATRNGFSEIRIVFNVEGNASNEELAALVERSKQRSMVYDMLTNGTKVSVDVA